MMGYIKYYIKPFCFAILIFLLIFGLFKYSMTPNGYKIQSWNVVSDLENAIGRNNLGSEFYKVTKKPATIIISSSVDAGHLLSLKEGSTKYLYLPQIDNSYFAVYIDGKQIGTLGFKDKRTGHFWYQPVIFELPESFSNIRLEISGIYEIGIDFGAYIIDSSQLPKYNVLLFLTNSLLHITIGLALTISIILYAISKNLVPEKKRAYLYLGLGSFLGSIWMFDLVGFPSLGSQTTFLLFRKIFLSSAYFGLSAFITGFSNIYFERKTNSDKIFALLTFVTALALTFPTTSYVFKNFTNVASLVLSLTAIYILLRSFKIYSNILFGFITFFATCVVYDAVVVMFSFNLKLMSNYGIAAIFAGFAYSVVFEYKEMFVKVTLTHMKSITDELTGAYNRGVLPEITTSKNDTFVYIDLDNLKDINDIYGHDVGDEVLKLLVENIKSHLRSTDLIIRMGGDEFLVILKDCTKDKANEIFERLSLTFMTNHPLHPTFSYGILTFEKSFSETLKNVDMLMYKMKESKKIENLNDNEE